MSMYAVRQIKALNHLYCKRHKRFKRTTNSDHNRAIYENLLEQQFSITNQIEHGELICVHMDC